MINFTHEAKSNSNFRKVLQTTEHSQVVVMSLKPGEDIGLETHPHVDQALFLVSGQGKAIVDGEEANFVEGDLVAVPAGAAHNIINQGERAMKLITVYSPANHAPNTVHATKADAEAAEMAKKS